MDIAAGRFCRSQPGLILLNAPDEIAVMSSALPPGVTAYPMQPDPGYICNDFNYLSPGAQDSRYCVLWKEYGHVLEQLPVGQWVVRQ